VVTAIEMSGNDRRAFVECESAGKKQQLLKFAQIRQFFNLKKGIVKKQVKQ